jgi:CheY-like chemotaxis protein
LDTGIGIAGDKTAVIFQRFQQVDRTVEKIYGGTGLGLAIVKHLVEMMSGRISVQSSRGKGSIFSFNVKLQVASLAPWTHRESLAVDTQTDAWHSKQPLRILVVDDSEDNRLLLKEYLRPLGHHVELAESGRVALDKFGNNGFDLVLMDLQMPILDGYATTRMIRNMEADRKMKKTAIIALTARAFADERIRSIDAGCDSHLSKPVKKTTLLQTIAGVVDTGVSVENPMLAVAAGKS